MLVFTQHLQLFLLMTSFIGLMHSKNTKINLQKLLQLFSKRMKRDIGDDMASILVSSGILTVNDNKRVFPENWKPLNDWPSPDTASSSQQFWTTTIPLTKDLDDLENIIGLKPPAINSISDYISYSPISSRSSSNSNKFDYNFNQHHHHDLHHQDHYYHPHSDDFLYNTEVLANDFLDPVDLLLTESKLPKGITIGKDHLGTTNGDFLTKSKHYVKSYGK